MGWVRDVRALGRCTPVKILNVTTQMFFLVGSVVAHRTREWFFASVNSHVPFQTIFALCALKHLATDLATGGSHAPSDGTSNKHQVISYFLGCQLVIIGEHGLRLR